MTEPVKLLKAPPLTDTVKTFSIACVHVFFGRRPRLPLRIYQRRNLNAICVSFLSSSNPVAHDPTTLWLVSGTQPTHSYMSAIALTLKRC